MAADASFLSWFDGMQFSATSFSPFGIRSTVPSGLCVARSEPSPGPVPKRTNHQPRDTRCSRERTLPSMCYPVAYEVRRWITLDRSGPDSPRARGRKSTDFLHECISPPAPALGLASAVLRCGGWRAVPTCRTPRLALGAPRMRIASATPLGACCRAPRTGDPISRNRSHFRSSRSNRPEPLCVEELRSLRQSGEKPFPSHPR